MAETGVQKVDTYAACCQNTITKFIVTRPIIDLCLASVRRPGARVLKRWWEQVGLDMEVIWYITWVEETYRYVGEQAGEEEEGDTEAEN